MSVMMPSAMGIPVSFRNEMDPISELVSDIMNFPNGVPERAIRQVTDIPDLKEEYDQPQVRTPSEDIRIAVEILLGAEPGSAAYLANLEIAKGYISKEIASI